jgi:DNA-binding response OmpR family regulator
MKGIIYVEDNVDTAEAVRQMLTYEGYLVTTVASGKEGVDLSLRNSYDLHLLDIMLPDMSGWDIYEAIRGRVKGKVAFLSAIPVSSDRIDELRRTGVSDYIIKPFSRKELVERIRKMLAANP